MKYIPNLKENTELLDKLHELIIQTVNSEFPDGVESHALLECLLNIVLEVCKQSEMDINNFQEMTILLPKAYQIYTRKE